MKQEISPVVAIVLIVLILAVIGGVYYYKTTNVAGSGGSGPPPLNPSTGKTLADVMSRAGSQKGSSAPAAPAGPGAAPVLPQGGIPTPPAGPR